MRAASPSGRELRAGDPRVAAGRLWSRLAPSAIRPAAGPGSLAQSLLNQSEN